MLTMLFHQGLGDMIIMSGLVREYAKTQMSIVLICKRRDYESVRFMYSDLKNVYVLPLEGDVEARRFVQTCEGHVLKLGLFGDDPSFNIERFDSEHYRQAKVDFEKRWSEFKVPKQEDQEPWGKFDGLVEKIIPRIFVHDDPTRKFPIRRDLIPNDRVRLIWPGTIPTLRHSTIFSYTDAISEADEVHVIDSSFLCLADSIPTRGKLFLHRYARKGGRPPQLRKDWKVLD